MPSARVRSSLSCTRPRSSVCWASPCLHSRSARHPSFSLPFPKSTAGHSESTLPIPFRWRLRRSARSLADPSSSTVSTSPRLSYLPSSSSRKPSLPIFKPFLSLDSFRASQVSSCEAIGQRRNLPSPRSLLTLLASPLLLPHLTGSTAVSLVGGTLADVWVGEERGLPMALFSFGAFGATVSFQCRPYWLADRRRAATARAAQFQADRLVG